MFLRLQSPKDVLRSTSKKSRFRLPFEKQHDKRVSKLFKSERQHLYHISCSMWMQLSWKKFLLVICKISRLFVNTMSADDKYSLLNRDNLAQQIQMQLSQKQKNFFWFFFVHFSNVHQIFWSMWRQLSCKKSLLVICKIFRVFVNTLSSDDKYALLNIENLTQRIQMQLSQRQKTFLLNFFLHFWNLV